MNTSNRDSRQSFGAVILIGLGVVFLLGQMFNFNVWDAFGSLFDFAWPFWIILPGAAMLAVAVLGSGNAVKLAVPGMVIGGTGLILLFQETFDRYETWSYLWALYPVFVGTALMYIGWRTGDEKAIEGGRRSAGVGIVLLLVFGGFMELIFSDNFDTLWRYGVPLVLIGGGVLLLTRNNRQDVFAKRKNEVDVPVNGKSKNGYAPSARRDLQRQIDEALAEDDPNRVI